MIKSIYSAFDLSRDKIINWTKLIGTFLVGQGASHAIKVISGFLLMRWLSVDQFAQYNLAFAFQSTAYMLVEFGFSGAIVALVGHRINDKKAIGEYIKAGQFYRNRTFIVIAVACIVAFPLMTASHNWSHIVTFFLLVSIITNLYFSGISSFYSPPLKMHKKISTLYGIQVKFGLFRLMLLWGFYIITVLNAWIAALTNSLLTVMGGLVYKKKSADYIELPESSSKEVRREMVNYIKPIMPGMVFAALQGHIMVFVSSIFGESGNIAEIGALNRLGQLYFILSMAGVVLIAPYLAKQPEKGLLLKYLSILGLMIGISSLIVIGGYLLPGPLLWLIGDNYDHLNTELVFLLINSGLGFINGLMWQMNAARKWLYNWMPMVSIPGTIIIQALCIIFIDLSITKNVLIFSIITNVFVLGIRILVAWVGISRQKQI